MALNDDDMWNGRATARLDENLSPPQPVRHHPLRVVTILLGVASAMFAPMLLRADEFLALALAGAFLGGAHSALLWTATNRKHPVTFPVISRISGTAAAGSVVAVTGGCLYPSIGVPGAAGVLAALVATPYLFRRLTGRHDRPAPAPATRVPRQQVDLPTPPLARRSIVEIVAAWTASKDLLRRTTSARDRAHIAALRQAYLDELERRDSAGVGRWLGSGDALTSDVTRYLAPPDRENPGPDAR